MRIHPTAATLLLLLLIASTASATAPNLTSLRPVGGQRGTEVEVELGGARLGDAKEILWYQPGIELLALTTVDDAHVKAKLKIAPDCVPGVHDLRLRTATGVSELHTFSVGTLKEAKEVEPNNDFAKPQPIEANSVVNGVAENEDVDYYAVPAKKGDRISVEVEGMRLGITMFDPSVAILDAKRFELASSDDAAAAWVDGFASVLAPEDGTYIVQVRECSYAGNGNCLYRLHVGDFPRPTAAMPPGGMAGQAVEVHWIGDPRGERITTLALPAGPARSFGVVMQDDKGVAPFTSPLRVSTFPNVMGVEPDEAKFTPFQAPAALNGVIGAAGDEDRYVFPAKKGQYFEARVYARFLGSPLDAVIHIVKQGGAYLIGNDDSTLNGVATPDSAARFSIPEDGDYVVLVHDQLRKGGPDYFYRIEVAPLVPRHLISPQLERASQAAQGGAVAIAVPKGNRQAILVNSSWVDTGGDVIIGVEGLPPGVTMEADTQPGSHGNLLLMFSAAPEAAPSGALITLRGKHADPTKTLPSPSEVTAVTELVTAPVNNLNFWGRTVDRLALAVTDESPFSIEIVEPKVPLVRNGSMGLKVVAHRKEGFKAPIAIILPWNPPGVTSGGGVVIPEGQNEAVIPLNADGAAELRTARIAVNGTAGVINGPMMVSSPLAKLTVAAPFVNLTLQAGSVEQGKETDIAVKVDRAADFPADAPTTATLLGLPTKVVSEPRPITKETQDLVFHIKSDPTSPAGNHTTLMCQVVITRDGEPIVHNFGGGQLRIDAPLPPKPNAPPAPPAAVVAAPQAPAAASAAAPPKPPTRLEKLRLERQEQVKAAAAAIAAATPPVVAPAASAPAATAPPVEAPAATAAPAPAAPPAAAPK